MHLLNPYDLSTVVMTIWGPYSLVGCLLLNKRRHSGNWLLFGLAWVAFAILFAYIRIVGHAL